MQPATCNHAAAFGALLSVLLSLASHAEPPVLQQIPSQSNSGQFLVYPANSAGPALAPELATNLAVIRLDPAMLTVSCERIKQALYRELAAASVWKGKIYIALYPGSQPNQPIRITSEKLRDGWRYGVELPDAIERTRYVRAMVQVVMQEMANRQFADHSAELPLWLVEGLTRQLLASDGARILLPAPRARVNGLPVTYAIINNARLESPDAQVRRELRGRALLGFADLSWPSSEQISTDQDEVFGASAHLFVSELLALKDGPGCLRAFLAQLSQHYNWQVAFLLAFQQFFQRPLDVEKWWALRATHFEARETSVAWRAADSWNKLDEALRVSVQVRTATNDLPLHSTVKLQTVLREWNPPRQFRAIQDTLQELNLVGLRASTNMVPVIEQYQKALETFLIKRQKEPPKPPPPGQKAELDDIAKEAIKKLDALDLMRETLRDPIRRNSAQPKR